MLAREKRAENGRGCTASPVDAFSLHRWVSMGDVVGGGVELGLTGTFGFWVLGGNVHVIHRIKRLNVTMTHRKRKKAVRICRIAARCRGNFLS